MYTVQDKDLVDFYKCLFVYPNDDHVVEEDTDDEDGNMDLEPPLLKRIHVVKLVLAGTTSDSGN